MIVQEPDSHATCDIDRGMIANFEERTRQAGIVEDLNEIGMSVN